MRLTIVLDLDNAAFGDTRSERGAEVANILDTYRQEIDYRGLDIGDSGVMRDTNGNTVGYWEVMDQPQC